MGMRSDGELLDSAGHDEAAFEEFVGRHRLPLVRYVNRRLGSAFIDDIVSETFAVAFARRARFDITQADARPWLFGIATNLIRRHSRAEAKTLAAYAKTGVDPTTPDLSESARAIDSTLAGVLAALRPRYRDVLFLHAICDLSHEEIATALDVPVGTARGWLHRARVSAMKELTARGYAHPTVPADSTPKVAEP